MAVVSTDFLAGVLTNFRALWQDAFFAAQIDMYYPRIAMEVPSTTLTETYNWLGTVPQMRKWVDERQISGLNSFNYSLTNDHFEVTIEVDRDTFEDDRIGLIRPRVQQLGMEAPRYIENSLVNALVNGATSGNNSYDGVTFYNSAHIVGSAGSQTNLVTYTGGTLLLVQADFSTAKAQMRKVKDDQNRPMGLVLDFVLCAPEQEQIFRQLLNASFIPSAAVGSMENTFVGQADLGVSPFVTASTWHGLATKMAIKPLIFQNRKAPEFAALDRPDSTSVFNLRMFRYGVDMRAQFGYGSWECAVKVA